MTVNKELSFANSENELRSGFSLASIDKNSAWPDTLISALSRAHHTMLAFCLQDYE